MVDLIVKDYLACRDVRIGVRGLTVVRGESYSGKSSMFRGLVSAFTNRWSSRCVRWGCSCSSVSVRFSEGGPVLRVVKGNKVGARYELDGVVYDKTGRDVPGSVSSFLGFGCLDSGSDSVSLSFWPQFRSPLLLSYSQSRVRAFLGSGRGLDDLGLCSDGLRRRSSEVAGGLRALDGLIDGERVVLEGFRGLLSSGSSLCSFVSDRLSSLSAVSDRLSSLSELLWFVRRRLSLSGIVCGYRTYLSSLDGLSSVCRRFSSVSYLLGVVSDRSSLLSYVTRCRVVLSGYASFLFDLGPDGSYGVLLGRLSSMSSLRACLLSCSSLLASVSRLRYGLSFYNSCSYVCSSLSLTTSRSVFLSDLVCLLRTRDALTSRIESLRRLSSSAVCPLCGGPLGCCSSDDSCLCF